VKMGALMYHDPILGDLSFKANTQHDATSCSGYCTVRNLVWGEDRLYFVKNNRLMYYKPTLGDFSLAPNTNGGPSNCTGDFCYLRDLEYAHLNTTEEEEEVPKLSGMTYPVFGGLIAGSVGLAACLAVCCFYLCRRAAEELPKMLAAEELPKMLLLEKWRKSREAVGDYEEVGTEEPQDDDGDPRNVMTPSRQEVGTEEPQDIDDPRNVMEPQEE